MSDEDWLTVLRSLRDLWPRAVDAMTNEQVRVWRDRLDPFAAANVQHAWLEHYAESNAFAPSLPAVLAKSRDAVHRRQADPRTSRSHDEGVLNKIAQHDARVDTVIDRLSDEQLSAHTRIILAADRRARWMAGRNPRANHALRNALLRRVARHDLDEHDRRHVDPWDEERYATDDDFRDVDALIRADGANANAMSAARMYAEATAQQPRILDVMTSLIYN